MLLRKSISSGALENLSVPELLNSNVPPKVELKGILMHAFTWIITRSLRLSWLLTLEVDSIIHVEKEKVYNVRNIIPSF